MKIVTFLVPCYNVADCVSRCIESMIEPEVVDKIEVLLINDGSRDYTGSCLRQYERKYSESVRVIDKENGGWGTAINLGIREATGKYIKEVDADDRVERENLVRYIEQLEQSEADMVVTEFSEYNIKSNERELRSFAEEIYNREMSYGEFWERYSEEWKFSIHAITYKREFLQRIDLQVGDRYYGDFEYICYPQPYISSMVVLPMEITVYTRGESEQSTSYEGYCRNYRDMISLALRLSRFYGVLPKTMPEKAQEHMKRCILGTIEMSYQLMLSPAYVGRKRGIQSERKYFDNKLKQTSPLLYAESGEIRKRGIPYIKIWRKSGINLLVFKRKRG